MMAGKYAEKVYCVKVEKRMKETLYVFLCEWSDVTASYVGRTGKALCNLQKYVNEKLSPVTTLSLKLKEYSLFSFLRHNKNVRILNDFFKIIVKQPRLVKDVEVNRFFTNGSSPTLKEFMNTFKRKPISQFSFDIELPNHHPGEYEEIGHFESSSPSPDSEPVVESPLQVDVPTYSVVKKRPNSDEPDIVTSSKTSSSQDSLEIPPAEVITTPPKPPFEPPSLPGKALISASPVRPLELKVVALQDYESTSDRVLSFAKGSPAEVIAQSESGWWCIRLGTRIGWVPGEYWQIDNSKISAMIVRNNSGWFVGNISRAECESMMMRYAKEADFVVRQSANGNLALSVKHDDEVRHFPIRVTNDGRFDIGRYEFKSVSHIVSYYRKNVLFYDDREMPVKLGRPMVIVVESDSAAAKD